MAFTFTQTGAQLQAIIDSVETFDTAPTADSANPVTSGGIKTALDGKQNTLTIDPNPTQSSANPVQSGGVYTALGNKANTASPTLTGTPKAPTANAGTNNTQIATTAFVQTAVANKAIAYPLVNSPAWNSEQRAGSVTPSITLPSIGTPSTAQEFRYIFTAASTNATFTAPSGATLTDGDTTTAAGGSLALTSLTASKVYECSFVVLSTTSIALIMKEW